ncbi:MAG: bifunctional riboflavin kinase/FAD synthetase [Gammaproteobacteria bacterium]|nr:bifunctional riboflavin kinase/FAD synthetase [Gammaproteobacteria bacterium]NNC68379.1 bifunctional riboflavin kinase/FAD synthetase [Gammaproteobacteria bacterium]
MQLIRTIHNHKSDSSGAVATIGNFDGVHLGHQVVINKITQQSKELNLPSMVIAFEPSAKEFFFGQDAPARLTNFREKFSLIDKFGIDQFICLNFNRELSNMPAETFIKKILVDTLHIKHLTVGDNFRFGKDRKGDFELLQNFAGKLDYQVEDTDSFVNDGKRVSSTLIRKFLKTGELDKAKSMLGREYFMSGRVIHGDKKGRTIGFPTANIPVKRRICAVNGVFAVNVSMNDGSEYQGVANIGHRPTVAGTRTQLEVHIFNFSKEIYGNLLKITFCKKLRDEKKFDSFEELKKQIEQDSKSAQDFFSIAA